MTYGKRTCKILKEIRQQIADRNDIDYITSECHFQGECKGTCPKCEAELQYLENELSKRRQLGKAVAVAGISLGIAGSFSACHSSPKQENIPILEQEIIADTVKVDTIPLIPPPDIYLDGIVIPDWQEEIVPVIVEGDIRVEDPEWIEITKLEEVIPDDTFTEDPIFEVVDSPPQYPGGEVARMQFLMDNITYPGGEMVLSGRVLIRFVIEKDGSLTNFKILSSVHSRLDEEVLRVVKLMPKWVAGTHQGKPVRVQYKMPITFSLGDE